MIDWDLFKLEYVIGPPVFVLLIFLAVLIHEMGHFLMARLFQMPVGSVVIGRGRTLKYWQTSAGTRWSIRLWPVGAYVHLSGMDDEGQNESAFIRRPFWQRMLTILAGPGLNIAILPFLFFTFYAIVGQPSTPPVLTGVEKELVSDRAGLKPRDVLLAVDGVPVTNTADIWRILYAKEVAESELLLRRGEKEFTVKITPDWAEYMDDRGVPRKNSRFGVVWQHTPFKLIAIASVNGTSTNDKDDVTRDLLIKNFDRNIVLGLKGPDEKPGLTEIYLFKQANLGLLDKKDKHYAHVFLGETRGSVYLQKPLKEDAVNASRYAVNLVKKIALVPFQLFPIDVGAIKDEHAVSNRDTRLLNILYNYLHLFAVANVLVALINLLPLPHFDGGQLVIQAIERIRKDRLTRKQKAKIFAIAFLGVYLGILFTNLDNVPGYIDSRLKKVHEFIDTQTSDAEG